MLYSYLTDLSCMGPNFLLDIILELDHYTGTENIILKNLHILRGFLKHACKRNRHCDHLSSCLAETLSEIAYRTCDVTLFQKSQEMYSHLFSFPNDDISFRHAIHLLRWRECHHFEKQSCQKHFDIVCETKYVLSIQTPFSFLRRNRYSDMLISVELLFQ